MIRDPKLFKMSQFFESLTSSSLTPYYSYRALEARGKPSTWLPRGGLVEHIFLNLRTKQRTNRPTKQPANKLTDQRKNKLTH